jgi:uncharacterized iron-regulated membrane protein
VNATRALYVVHKWTGLITGINILILSLTGAILVFHEEIHHAFEGPRSEPFLTIDPKQPEPFQAAFDALLAKHDGAAINTLQRSHESETEWNLFLLRGDDEFLHYIYDDTTGNLYTESHNAMHEVMEFILILHANLYLGLAGTVLVGTIAILFFTSTLSGIFIYAPFMKAALFGALDWRRGLRRSFADLHKLVGAVSLAFNVIIAATGFALTIGFLIVQVWMLGEIQKLTVAEQHERIPGAPLPSIDRVMKSAIASQPDVPLDRVIFPSSFQGENHFMALHQKPKSLMEFVPSVTLVPVARPEAALATTTPLWVKAMLIAAPFHFGNFAGLGVKVAWCALGITSGVLSITGAALSVNRWRKQWRIRRRRRASRLAPAPVALNVRAESEP